MPIGGGRDYPDGDETREQWLRELRQEGGLPLARLQQLFGRYGARAAEFSRYVGCQSDGALANHPGYSRREIEFILREEKVERLDDLLLRRSLIAMLGELTRELLQELAEIAAGTLGWSAERQRQEIERAIEILRRKHRVEL